MSGPYLPIREAVRVVASTEPGVRIGTIHPGFDVFSIPNGGYVAAIAASAILEESGKPDIFSLTVHYLRKTVEGPITFRIQRVGGSRRLTSYQAVGTQGEDERPVLSLVASVGDRTLFSGGTHFVDPVWTPVEADLMPRMASGPPPAAPNIAERVGSRIEASSSGGLMGKPTGQGVVRATMNIEPLDQLAAIVACDATAPAVWNILGPKGWVPTVELTVHVRARGGPGPARVVARTANVQDGFLEEDCLVHDANGKLIVQSRQLACWTSA